MFKTIKHVATRRALLTAALFAVAAPSFAQAPTGAQKSAIRSACRADYQAHCSSVAPGGAEALQCLSKNMSSLSSACQSAVRAIEPAAAPKTDSKTEAAPPKSEPAKSEPAKTEAAPAAQPAAKPAAAAAPKAAAPKQPSSAQVAAIRSACRADYPKVCASVPPGGAAALECLEKNKAKVSPACEKAVNAASGGAAAAAPAGAAPAAAATPAATPTVIVLRPLRPREELLIVRSACGGDIRTLCAGVAPGGGRIAQCLASNAAGLSPACKEVLAPFAAR
ncbi:cysteine rich repeat-containing protein [Bradyrhizobium sp. CB1650]|uniref:cysteine rich repeat-containing protein n=1 Tax=Bradyrhizobium sp. CB1650 TaxID=3039153 RepID=UPI0024353E56|nr:cysteine rich repeat-containing protein [Bradyrhizobium sp. CB1650]WGD53058.1 cysteine rich repeat-containing protein [Bradyrhizobium sp. CB1650]